MVVVDKLSVEQTEKILKLGFGKILQMYSFNIGILLSKFLADAYDIEKEVFKIGDKQLRLSVEDVVFVTGLKNNGKKIVVKSEYVNKFLLDLYAGPNSKQLSCDKLAQDICNSQVAGEHFVQRFLLLMISTLLAPKQKDVIPRFYLNLVENLSEVSGMNWAEFTRTELINSIIRYKQDRKSCLGGNLALLMVWYFEHFQSLDQPSKIYLPLMHNWTEDRIKDMRLFDAENVYGSGKFVRRFSDLFKESPTSNVKKMSNLSKLHLSGVMRRTLKFTKE